MIDTLLLLDDKLCRGGVDDSDGAVGGFIEEVVVMLQEYAKLDAGCAKTFSELKGKETCFGWEEPLLELENGVSHHLINRFFTGKYKHRTSEKILWKTAIFAKRHTRPDLKGRE